MPELPESVHPAPDEPRSITEWESREGFRQTFLSQFTDPAHEEALRRVGQLLYSFALEPPQGWPEPRETSTLTECVAALCDVRFLAGYLRSVGREREVSSLSKRDTALSHLGERISVQLIALGEQMEAELSRWDRR
jgi:hypothetical protein